MAYHRQQHATSSWPPSRGACSTQPNSHLERQGRGRGRVPEGHKSHGQVHAGRLPVDPAGHRHDRERLHTGQSVTGPSSGQVHAVALFQTKGRLGPQGDLTRERSALTARLRVAATLRPGEAAEVQEWSAHRRFIGHIIVDERVEALQRARELILSGPTVHAWTTGGWKRRASGSPQGDGPTDATTSAITRRSSTRRPMPSTRLLA